MTLSWEVHPLLRSVLGVLNLKLTFQTFTEKHNPCVFARQSAYWSSHVSFLALSPCVSDHSAAGPFSWGSQGLAGIGGAGSRAEDSRPGAPGPGNRTCWCHPTKGGNGASPLSLCGDNTAILKPQFPPVSGTLMQGLRLRVSLPTPRVWRRSSCPLLSGEKHLPPPPEGRV